MGSESGGKVEIEAAIAFEQKDKSHGLRAWRQTYRAIKIELERSITKSIIIGSAAIVVPCSIGSEAESPRECCVSAEIQKTRASESVKRIVHLQSISALESYRYCVGEVDLWGIVDCIYFEVAAGEAACLLAYNCVCDDAVGEGVDHVARCVVGGHFEAAGGCGLDCGRVVDSDDHDYHGCVGEDGARGTENDVDILGIIGTGGGYEYRLVD